MSPDKHHFAIHSISELHRLLGMPKPHHPLVSLIQLETIDRHLTGSVRLTFDFYSVLLKRNVPDKIRYGQQYYDFDEGILALLAPQQVLHVEDVAELHVTGWWLVFHADFVRLYPLGRKIQEYGFFSYAANEALNLSAREEDLLLGILQHIHQEYLTSIDKFSQDVMVSQLEVLLNYTNRFYNRQFLTRRTVNSDVLSRFQALLADYFASARPQEQGLPSVQYLAEQLHLSPSYLSDLLKEETGQSALHHIHHQLLQVAKNALAATANSVGEVAYQLGFQHLQSFNKLFKQKTGQTPLQYRHSLN